MGFGPNALETCPSESRRRTHWALAEICPVCEPGVEWRHPCPQCREPVTVKGVHVQPHAAKFLPIACSGAGQVVAPRRPVRGPLVRPAGVRHRALVVVGPDGAA